MTSVTFDVIGLPRPQGSKRAVGKGVMVESSPYVEDWRQAVAGVAAGKRDALGRTLDGPLSLFATFRFPMTEAARRTARTSCGASVFKATAPDLDKLLRAVMDALTQSGLIADDARIVFVTASKVHSDTWTGARLVVSEAPAHTMEGH